MERLKLARIGRALRWMMVAEFACFLAVLWFVLENVKPTALPLVLLSTAACVAFGLYVSDMRCPRCHGYFFGERVVGGLSLKWPLIRANCVSCGSGL